MKRIFALLITAATFTSAFAQQEKFKDSRTDNHSKKEEQVYQKNFSSSVKERDEQVQRIKREFEQKIELVRYNRRLKNSEKTRQINLLERQRDQKLNDVARAFQNKNAYYNDKYATNNKKH